MRNTEYGVKKPAAKPATQSKPPAAGKSKSRPDPIAAASNRDLAKLVGRTHTAVNGWLKRDDWTFGTGPWRASDVVRIQQWAEATLLERPATADTSRSAVSATDGPAPVTADRGLESLSIPKRADVALKMKRREVLDFGLQVRQGKFHEVEQCQRDRPAAIHEVKQGLLDLADGFPGTPEDKAILRGRIFELLRRFSAGMGVMPPVADAPANH